MQRFATLLAAACAALVAIAPAEASAGWRRGWGYYGPGVNVYVGPGWAITATAIAPTATMAAATIPTPIIPIGADITGGAGATKPKAQR